MKRVIHSLTLLAAVVVVHAPSVANACGVCMGQSDGGKVGAAVNGAMFLMIGFIGAMLAGMAAVGYSIVKRSQNPLYSHVELAEVIGTPTTR